MEFLTPQFLSSLAAIVVIDLMLAGDNAIVIALAARNVPAHLQKRVIAWGTVGAIAVRSLMTLVVVWLLQIPGLLFIGGALLIWIAYKLLLPDEAAEGEHGALGKANGFWGAMRTIVIADAVMGLDNVLAVAGAAHGNYVLVVLGLLISVPIVVWGSQWLLKWVERYPVIVYLGAGVLAGTAVKHDRERALPARCLRARRAVPRGAPLPAGDRRRALRGLRAQPPPPRIAHLRTAGEARGPPRRSPKTPRNPKKESP